MQSCCLGHQLCQEPAKLPRKLSSSGTGIGLYSTELAVCNAHPLGHWTELPGIELISPPELGLPVHVLKRRRQWLDVLPACAEAGPVPRWGHLSLKKLSSFQSLSSGLYKCFSLRKGMNISVFSTPPVGPTCKSFPSLLHFQLAP